MHIACGIGGIDLIFVVDQSESVGASNFGEFKEFMESVSSMLQITSSGSHVAVSLIHNVAEIYFDFSMYSDQTSLLQAIQAIPFNEGNFSFANGLNFLTSAALNRMLGRSNINQQIALILTDGEFNNDETRNAALNLHLTNIFQIYAIGTRGSNVDQLSIITNGDTSMAFYINTFNTSILTNIENEVSQQSCVGK